MATTTPQGIRPDHSAAARLSLRFLGACEITLDGKALADLGSRKAQALLCYLAVTAKPVTRDFLTALFWPEMNEPAAKNNLRSTLTMLRKHLDPCLTITPATISFNQQFPYQLDVELLGNAIKAAQATQNLGALQLALDHYQGEFLSGFHINGAARFEEWLLQQREQLHLLVLRTLETLTAHAIAQGQYQIGLDAGHRLLAMEPWAETAHRQVMLLFALAGQRGRALQQYKTCCCVLADELGVEPMAETTALYRQIQSGQIGPAPISPKDVVVVTHDEALVIDAKAAAIHSAVPISASNETGRGVALPNNLQTPLTTFIGRQLELTTLVEQLTKNNCRLLTIFGPGGVGKSSLALAVGQRLLGEAPTAFADGIFFVPLAGVEIDAVATAPPASADPKSVGSPIITAIAEAIGCQCQAGRPLRAQLISYLQHRRLLLILDNFEQLVAQANILVTLLAHAPTVTMLVTSRLRLNLRGEMTLALGGLSWQLSANGLSLNPRLKSHEQIEQVGEAVALFVDRAQKLNPNFVLNAETIASISQICRTVGGLPLAIEMTAACTNIYRCAEIAERLTMKGREGELLTSPFRDQPSRHHNLQKVFADSWALLDTPAQWALAKISIFSSAFTRAAAQAIAELAVTDLMQLCDHAMLQIDEEYRYSLHPLIRQFAAQQWQELTAQLPAERKRLAEAHSVYYLQRVARLAKHPQGEAELATIHALKQEHGELVRGWQYAMQQDNQEQIQASMAGFFRYLTVTNQSAEGKVLFGLVKPDQNDSVVQWLQVAQCHFLRRLAEYDAARQQLAPLLALLSSAAVDDASANAQPTTASAAQLVRQTYIMALCELGWISYEQGHYEAAQNNFATACTQAERMNDHAHLMAARNGLGAAAFSLKQYDLARVHYEAALAYAKAQADLHYTAIVLGNLIAHAQTTKALTQAQQYLQMRLEIDQKTQNVRQMAISYQRLGQMALIADAFAEAEAYLRESLALFVQLGSSPEVAHLLLDLSKSLLHQQRIEEAVHHCLHSLQLAMQAQMTPRILAALTLLAEIRLAEGKQEDVITLLQMVNRNGQMPAATWRRVQKIEETLLTALGEEVILPLRQAPTMPSLQAFSAQLLRQAMATGNVNAPLRLSALLSSAS